MASTSNNEQFSEQNKGPLKEVAMVGKQYVISDRADGAVATATLKAFGLVTGSESKYIIDRRKLRRERSKCREEIRLEEDRVFGLVNSFYVDGRKDATIKMIEEENIIEKPLLRSIMLLWESPTNFTCLILRVLEELV